jgi:hypothetical protein
MPIEAAFKYGDSSTGWYVRITWHCDVCSKRNHVLKTGAGTAENMEQSLPLTVKCKDGHECEVVPYRWTKGTKL